MPTDPTPTSGATLIERLVHDVAELARICGQSVMAQRLESFAADRLEEARAASAPPAQPPSVAAVPPAGETDLHQQIMNIGQKPEPGAVMSGWAADFWRDGYRTGHRDARHAAAELVAARSATQPPAVSALREALETVEAYLRDTLAPCEADCTCVLHTVQAALTTSSAAPASPWKAIDTFQDDGQVVVWNGQPWRGYYEENDGWSADLDGELLRLDPQPTHWIEEPPASPPAQERSER